MIKYFILLLLILFLGCSYNYDYTTEIQNELCNSWNTIEYKPNTNYYYQTYEETKNKMIGDCGDVVIYTIRKIYDKYGIKTNFCSVLKEDYHAVIEYNGLYIDYNEINTRELVNFILTYDFLHCMNKL